MENRITKINTFIFFVSFMLIISTILDGNMITHVEERISYNIYIFFFLCAYSRIKRIHLKDQITAISVHTCAPIFRLPSNNISTKITLIIITFYELNG